MQRKCERPQDAVKLIRHIRRTRQRLLCAFILQIRIPQVHACHACAQPRMPQAIRSLFCLPQKRRAHRSIPAGMKYRHYAPKAPVTVVTGDPEASARYIRTHLPEGAGVICFAEFKALFPGRSIHDLGPAADKAEQARRVFDALREFDHESVTEIYAQCPDTAGLGLAVANRLKKAAGFHVIEV